MATNEYTSSTVPWQSTDIVANMYFVRPPAAAHAHCARSEQWVSWPLLL